MNNKPLFAIDLVPPDNPERIIVKAVTDALLTDTQQTLLIEVRKVESRLKNAFPPTPIRNGLFERLRAATADGLNRDVAIAEQELNVLREDITSAGLGIRNQYVAENWKYSWRPIVVGVVLIVAWFFLIRNLTTFYDFAAPFEALYVNSIVNFIGAIGFSLIGLVIGVLFSVYFLNLTITYDSIEKIRRYRLSVSQFYLYLYVLLSILILLLFFNVIQIGVAQILLNDMRSWPWLGIFAGLVCGVSEGPLARMVSAALNPQRRA